MDLLLSRARHKSGEVLDRLSLDDWRRASILIDGLELTDFVPGRNPFTGGEIRIPRRGAGVWRFRGANYPVRFECGAVFIADGRPEMLPPLETVATHLGATVCDHDIPAFVADRLTLAQLLRRSFVPLSDTVEAFSRSTDLAADTQCLALEASAHVASSSDLARTLGYPYPLAPNDMLEQVACGARALREPPSDQLLVKALVHYMKHDAFLEVVTEP